MRRGSTALYGLGPVPQLGHGPAKGQLPPAQQGKQGSRRERDPLSLGRFSLSPQGLQSKIKSCWHNFCQHNPHGFSWDAQGRHGFPTHGCTCSSHPLLVNRSQSLSIEGSSATFGLKHSGKKQQSKISSSKRKAAHSIFKVRLSPITILSPQNMQTLCQLL